MALVVTGRRSLYDARAFNAMIVYANPFPLPPKRMNVCDDAPVNLQFVDRLAQQHWMGELPQQHVRQLLNPYEAACLANYFACIHLQDSVSVFLVPHTCHMAPFSSWYSSKPVGPSSVAHHTHQELWIVLLFAALDCSKYWLWFAKKESELLGELGVPSLQEYMLKYGH